MSLLLLSPLIVSPMHLLSWRNIWLASFCQRFIRHRTPVMGPFDLGWCLSWVIECRVKFFFLNHQPFKTDYENASRMMATRIEKRWLVVHLEKICRSANARRTNAIAHFWTCHYICFHKSQFCEKYYGMAGCSLSLSHSLSRVVVVPVVVFKIYVRNYIVNCNVVKYIFNAAAPSAVRRECFLFSVPLSTGALGMAGGGEVEGGTGEALRSAHPIIPHSHRIVLFQLVFATWLCHFPRAQF